MKSKNHSHYSCLKHFVSYTALTLVADWHRPMKFLDIYYKFMYLLRLNKNHEKCIIHASTSVTVTRFSGPVAGSAPGQQPHWRVAGHRSPGPGLTAGPLVTGRRAQFAAAYNDVYASVLFAYSALSLTFCPCCVSSVPLIFIKLYVINLFH